MGAWIETLKELQYLPKKYVAPYVGAWIETVYRLKDEQNAQSHPTWVRGLKRNSVTNLPKAVGRTLRGCVD